MKSTAKYILLICALVVGSLTASAQKKSADQVLASAATRLVNAKGVKADYTLSARGAKDVKGSFASSAGKLYISTPQSVMWYNGKNMWTYNAASKETTKVQPTKGEIAECNPLMYIAGNYKNFKAEYAKNQPKGSTMLILTPKGTKSEVQKAVLTLDAASLNPQKVVVRMDNKNVTILIRNLSLQAVAASTFEFTQSKYAKTKVVDLR